MKNQAQAYKRRLHPVARVSNRKRACAALCAALCALSVASAPFARAQEKPSIPSENVRVAAPAAAPMPFAPTEQLVYEASFSKLLLRGVTIAELTFNAKIPTQQVAANAVNETGGSSDAAYKTVRSALTESDVRALNSTADGAPPVIEIQPVAFVGDVVSEGLFPKLFGVNFKYHVESNADPQTFAATRTAITDEQGKRKHSYEALYDRKDKTVTWTDRDLNDPSKPPRVVNGKLESDPTFDFLAAIYFLRTQKLAPDFAVTLPVSYAGKTYMIPLRVSERVARMSTIVGKVPVWRVDVDVFGDNRLIEGKGKLIIWLTDDERRLPVRAKFTSDMGALDLTLKRVSTTNDTNSKPSKSKRED